MSEPWTLQFFVAGEPKPLARPRATRRGQHAGIYQEKPNWYAVVAHEAAQLSEGCCVDPVWVRLEFRMPRTKSYPKTREKLHVVRPDVDNLAKLVLDAITPALIANDTQVVSLHATKRYAFRDETPGCLVEITAVGAQEFADLVAAGRSE